MQIFAWRSVVAYSATATITILLLIWVLQLWRADMAIPFCYGPVCGGANRDLSFEIMLVKSIADHGWYLVNPSLGAPGISQLFDFPMSDGAHFLLLKLLTLFLSYDAALNTFFLLGFVLAAWSALFVFRQFDLAYPPAVAGALLFAFAPYHFYRGEGHLFLSSYYAVPLMILILVWVLQDRPLFSLAGRLKTIRVSREGWLSIAICALVGSAGLYYAFFGGLLLLMAGVCAIVKTRNWTKLLGAIVLGLVITTATVLNLAPCLVQIARHGRNSAVVVRSPVESEIYSLKIIQLLLPIESHRIPSLARFNAMYVAHGDALLSTESDHSSLGAIGSICFCLLLLTLLTGLPRFRHHDLWRASGILTVLSLLIGTVGGLGTILAYVMIREFRAYDRISIYIAFLALIALVILLDSAWQRRTRSIGFRFVALAVLPVTLLAGILDQTSKADVPPYQAARAAFQSDADFVSQVGSVLPANAMIFQLPYMSFPEHGPIVRMHDYDSLRPYFHSDRLRWSYGAAHGGPVDAWLEDTASQPPEELVKMLAVSDFSGIYIDRYGYTDSAASLESALSSLLTIQPIQSGDGRFLFFNLCPFRDVLRRTYSSEEWAKLREQLLHPLVIRWMGDFSYPESNPSATWRWSGRTGQLLLDNTSSHPVNIRLDMLVAAQNGNASLLVYGPGLSIPLKIDTIPRPLAFAVTLPPGRQTIRFLCDGHPLIVPAANRSLFFRVQNFRAALEPPSARRVVQPN